jgi:hypothetical protein
MKKNSIYIQQWLQFHPYESAVKSDYYYLTICNEVDNMLKVAGEKLFPDKKKENRKGLAIMLTCWFEDLVSETGMWNAFIQNHQRLYGKYLPFMDSDAEAYFDGEINPEDICFLMWYFLTIQDFETLTYSPKSELLIVLSEAIYSVFDREWDNAPVNTSLKSFLDLGADADFYDVRFVMDWLVLNSYLFKYLGEINEMEKIDLMNQLLRKKDFPTSSIQPMLFKLHDDNVHGTITHLMAMKGKEWLAWTLGPDHPLHKPLLEMSEKKESVYLFIGEDDKSLRFKHIASGEILNVTKESMDNNNFIPDKTILTTAFVNWKGEWWYSGTYVANTITDEILIEETADPYAAALFGDESKKREVIGDHYRAFLEFNNGKPTKFFRNMTELHGFIREFYRYHNEKISGVPQKENKRETGFDKSLLEGDRKDETNIILFFNKNSGLEIAFYGEYIPDENNPCYNPEHEPMEKTNLLFDKTVSKEFVEYVLGNYKISFNLFPNDIDNRLLLDNLDFILRFYKKDNYHTKPQITMV